MERAVIDTNIYIDWFNAGRHESVLFRGTAVKYLSSVVLMELLAGAFSSVDRRLVREVSSGFRKVGRILVPAASVYEDSGGVLRGLQEIRGYNVAGAYGLANDVLIAMSARSIGATVVTQNEQDFAAIRSIRPFELAIVP